MDKNTKMTSGEIAKKAGVSQKAVRLYDEKGLLKPTDYSEGNYRLYDRAALRVLEKIVALKQIGFSLEEIRDNLVSGEASNIEDALRLQLKEMEKLLATEKEGDLQKHHDEVCDMLKAEILTRYYYDEGRLAGALKTDKVVQKAIDELKK